MTELSKILDFTDYSPGKAALKIKAAEVRPLDLAALAETEPVQKWFVVPAIAPCGEVTLCTGAGSAGKSLLWQQLCTALATGLPTLGIEFEEPMRAVYITCEDNEGELHWRQAHICKALGVPMGELGRDLDLVSWRGNLDNSFGAMAVEGQFEPSGTYHRLDAFIEIRKPTLVVLDNVAHIFTGNENDRGHVTAFVNALSRLASKHDIALVVVAHPNKGGAQYSGSTAWLNAVRSQIYLEHDLKTDMRTLTIGKANYGPKDAKIKFAWADGAFVLERDLPPDTKRAMAERHAAENDNNAFLDCLATCTEQRRNVSHQPGINYAPKVFAGMERAKGMSPQRIAAAMERLLHCGMIELDQELWVGSNRHPKRGIRLFNDELPDDGDVHDD